MILLRVVYELFEWEAGTDPAPACEELSRQVRLEGADGARTFISWAWGQGQPDYFLAHGADTFFTDPPAAERDVSDSPVWWPLVGRPVTIGYRDRRRQVIEVRAGEAVAYCASYQSDCVFVMSDLKAGRRQIMSKPADGSDRRRGRRWLTAALVALLLVAAGGLFYYWMKWADARADRPDERADGYLKARDAFLADIEAGRLDQAYQSTTASFRRRVTREEFDERVRGYLAFKQRPADRGGSASSSGPAGGDVRGPNQMTLSETAEYADGTQTEVSVTVVFEDSFFDRRPPPPRIGDFTVEDKRAVPAPPAGRNRPVGR
jgi:hypothetical protein